MVCSFKDLVICKTTDLLGKCVFLFRVPYELYTCILLGHCQVCITYLGLRLLKSVVIHAKLMLIK